MPSSTPKQAGFMQAVAHGFKPDRTKAPPVKVAREFVKADKKKSFKQGGLVGTDIVGPGTTAGGREYGK